MPFSITLQPRDGGYVELGTQIDGGAGIVADSLTFGAHISEYGPLDASFRLKMHPLWPRNIIERATPIVVKRSGAGNVWSGRIVEAPSTYAEDAEVVVGCHGWGQHLKDDCRDKLYVCADLTRWRPTRSYDVAYSTWPGAFNVEAGNGIASIDAIREVPISSSHKGGITFDAGDDNTVKRIVVTYRGGGHADFALKCAAEDTPGALTDEYTLDAAAIATSDTTAAQTLTTARRYVTVYLANTSGGTSTPADSTASVKLLDILVFTDTAYESGNASALVASTVIGDTLDALCPLVSADRSKITTTEFLLPQFPAQQGWAYANQSIDEANLSHGYVARLTPDPVPVFEFHPVPTEPLFIVGAGEYTMVQPAAEDLRGVFSRVVAPYTDAAGVSSYEPALTTMTDAASQFTNPRFDTNTVGWDDVPGSITRDTAVYDTAPASARVTLGGGASVLEVTSSIYAPTLIPGRRYTLALRLQRASTMTLMSITLPGAVESSHKHYPRPTGSTIDALPYVNAQSLGVWFTYYLEFIAASPTDLGSFRISSTGAGGPDVYYIDGITLLDSSANVVTRRGFRRTALKPMQGATTAAAAALLAQLELDEAQYPPFKGTIGITGRVRVRGGDTVHVSELVRHVGDVLLIDNMNDPNTGNLGRTGNIQSVRYVEATDTAAVEIDGALSYLRNLYNRLALLAR